MSRTAALVIVGFSVLAGIQALLIAIDAPKAFVIFLATLLATSLILTCALFLAQSAHRRTRRYAGVILSTAGITVLGSAAASTVLRITLKGPDPIQDRSELIIEVLKHESVLADICLLASGCFLVSRGCDLLKFDCDRQPDPSKPDSNNSENLVVGFRTRAIRAKNADELRIVKRDVKKQLESAPIADLAILIDEIDVAISNEESRNRSLFPPFGNQLQSHQISTPDLIGGIAVGIFTCVAVFCLINLALS